MATINGEAKALFSLTVAEGKRLIGKAVAELPVVKKAYKHGRLIIANGITNAYIVEEILGQPIEKMRYTAGVVTQGQYSATRGENRMAPVCFEDGKQSNHPWPDILDEFTADDVFIKGANAIDPAGMAGVLVGAPNGGTCGLALGRLYARGSHVIVPVSREKLIPSVEAAVRQLGIHALDDSLGMTCGMVPIVGATVITEIEALSTLFRVEALQVSAGGVGGSEGSVGLLIRGDEEEVAAAMTCIRNIKGEPAVS
ncbi:MAG: hypothetical protein GX977_08745 [Firmicutes bacterium]|jgi:hypothetical protein|nr:hypothetical protein [Bacillota bacterium]